MMNTMIMGRVLAATVAALVVLLSGCSAEEAPTPTLTPVRPTKTPSSILRPANAGERINLARIGLLPPGAEALAVDLGKGRSLVSGILEKDTSVRPTHPTMVLTYGQHWAYVTCDWDGTRAIGTSVSKAKAQAAIRATVDYFGEDICELWVSPPLP